jgi:protein-tyrosine kinase
MSQFLSISAKLPNLASGPQPVGAVSQNGEIPLDLQQVPIQEIQLDSGSRIAVHSDPRGLAADRFRFLRLRLRELAAARKLKSILVTSPLPQDGKSTVALNLTTVLAEQGRRRVLLVEADLYHATIAEQLGVSARPGLAECLEGGLDPLSALRRIEPLGWYFLPGGAPHSNPTELMQSDRLIVTLEALFRHFDWVVIDSPPVAPVTDALSLARHVDASLVVARAGVTPQEAVATACTLLGPKHVIGIILNGVQGLERIYSKYYGRYGGTASTSSDGRI